MKISALVFAPVAALFIVQPSAAQQYAGSGWQPWLGCWQADGAPAGETLCIVPDGSGVRMVTVSGGAVRADSRIVADGQARRSDRDGCSSTETGRWSADRRRVFLTSQTRCDGDVTRDVSGMLAFLGPTEWLSVQTVTGNDGTATRSVRFERTAMVPQVIAAELNGTVVLRSGVVMPIEEQDVEEAMQYVDAAAVQEWLRSADAPFEVASAASASDSWSALDQVGRVSRDVRYDQRAVVTVVERPVYVVRSYGRRSYSWCWTPWGYDHFAWRVGPYIRISMPIVIQRGSRYGGRYVSYGYDRYRYPTRDRYDRYDRYDRHDRNDHGDRDDRYDRDDRDTRSRDGAVTRGGYTNRDRSAGQREPERTRGSTRTVQREPARASSGSSRQREPARATSGSNRGSSQRSPAASSSSGRTARARSGSR